QLVLPIEAEPERCPGGQDLGECARSIRRGGEMDLTRRSGGREIAEHEITVVLVQRGLGAGDAGLEGPHGDYFSRQFVLEPSPARRGVLAPLDISHGRRPAARLSNTPS